MFALYETFRLLDRYDGCQKTTFLWFVIKKKKKSTWFGKINTMVCFGKKNYLFKVRQNKQLFSMHINVLFSGSSLENIYIINSL